jgi:hypothetical protein
MADQTVLLDAAAVGVVNFADLNNTAWNSIASDGTKELASAGNVALDAGLFVVGLTLIITAGSVGVRFTGPTDVGAGGDALAPYPSFASSISIPVRGVLDRSPAVHEALTHVSLRPVGASGYAIIYYTDRRPALPA